MGRYGLSHIALPTEQFTKLKRAKELIGARTWEEFADKIYEIITSETLEKACLKIYEEKRRPAVLEALQA